MTSALARTIVALALVAGLSACGGGDGDSENGERGADPTLADAKAAALGNATIRENCDSLKDVVEVEEGTDIEEQVNVDCAGQAGILTYTRYGAGALELVEVHGLANPDLVHFRSDTVGITFHGSGAGFGGDDLEEERVSEEVANAVRDACHCGEVIPAGEIDTE